MSKKSSGRSLFDANGHRIGHVDDAHVEHDHPKTNNSRRILLFVVVFGLGYGLATDRGQALAAQVWHAVKQAAAPAPR